MSVNEYRRAPINHQNVDATPSKWSHKVFHEDTNYLRNYFIAYDVKGQVCHDALRASLSGKNHCVAPRSLTRTQVFPGRDPRNSSWTACVLLCPQNFNNLRRTYNSLLIPDPEWSPPVHINLFVHNEHELVTNWKFVTIEEKIFMPGRKLFISGLKY